MPRLKGIKKNGQFLPDNFAIASKFKQTPLEYMLSVINDPVADPERRDKMAKCAAAYCHPRIFDKRLAQKDAKASAATAAGIGTEWGKDLQFDEATPN